MVARLVVVHRRARAGRRLVHGVHRFAKAFEAGGLSSLDRAEADANLAIAEEKLYRALQEH